jgi:tetratricopeptide (TPR) repeat protein
LEHGEEHADEARLLFQAQGNLPMLADNLAQQATCDLLRFRLDAALQYAAEAEALSRRIGNGWNLSLALLVGGVAAWLRGEWSAALAHLEEGAREADIAGLVATQTIIPIQIGVLYRELGDLDKAQTYHLQAHQTACNRAPFLQHAVEAQLAIDAFAAMRVVEGAQWFAAAQAHIPQGAIGRAWLTLADIAHAAVSAAKIDHGWEDALRVVENSLAEAQQRRLDYYLPTLLLDKAHCLTGLNRQTEAVEAVQKLLSLDQVQRLDMLLWKGYATLGALYDAQGQTAQAQVAQEKANAAVRQIIHRLDSDELRARFLTSLLSNAPVT